MKAQEIKRIARFALFGAVGFGIGGLIAGAFHSLGGEDEFVSVSVFIMPIWGGLGAASLGLALQSNRTAVLSGLGCVAPIFGIMMVALFIFIMTTSDISIWLIYIVALITMSVAAGALFGLIIWGRSQWKKIIGLIFAGVFAFGISQLIIFLWYDSIVGLSTWGPDVVGFTVFGIIGGAFLGAALGYLEKGSETRNDKSTGN